MAAKETVEVVILGTNRASGVFATVAKSLGGIGFAAAAVVAGVAVAATAIVGLGVVSAKTAISVESSFAGILKTTEGLGDSFQDLTPLGETILQQYRDMAKEIPTTLEELMRIGELGGQLGIPEEALAGFTEVIAALGVTTNLTVESAAVDLARLQNIFEISANDITDNTERIGSSIVDLGNNFATTEAEIVSFATRIASSGKIVGFTQADILGISAAFSSVGIAAERGGTAVQKVVIKIAEAVASGEGAVKTFAETAGLSAKEFVDAWDTDPAKVFTQFVEGLGSAGDEAFTILSDLGLADQRLIQGFLAVGNAGDLMSNAIETSNAAWEENNALTEEAAKRYATTESQLKLTKNRFRDIGLTIGRFLLPGINDFLQRVAPELEKFGESISVAMQTGMSALESFQADPGGFIQNLLPELDASGFESFFEEFGSSISQTFADSFGAIGDRFSELSNDVLPFLVEQFNKVSDWFGDNGPLIQDFADMFSGKLEEAFDVVADAWVWMEPALEGMSTLILGLGTAALEVATGDWDGAWQTIQETIENVFGEGGSAEETITGFFEWEAGMFGTSLAENELVWQANADALKLINTTLWEDLKSNLGEHFEAINLSLEEKLGNRNRRWVASSEELLASDEIFWSSLIEKIALKTAEISANLAAWNASTNSEWSASLASMDQSVIDAWLSISTSFTTGLEDLAVLVFTKTNEISVSFHTWANTLEEILRSVAKKFLARGFGWMFQLAQGIASGVPVAVQAIQDAIAEILASIKAIIIPVSFGSPGNTPSGGGGGGGSTGSCFIAGTMVLTPGGETPIEEIKVDDVVLCHDDGLAVWTSVEKVLHHDPKPYLVIGLENDKVLGVTPEHPLFVNRKWKDAGDLVVGDLLLYYSHHTCTFVPVKVVTLAIVYSLVPVYNIHVQNENHNYFANGFVVHNAQVKAARGFFGVIPPGFPNDSFNIATTSGETAMVIPRGGFPGGGGGGGSRGSAPNITLVYAPTLSLADEFEVEKKFTPVMEEVIRKYELRNG